MLYDTTPTMEGKKRPVPLSKPESLESDFTAEQESISSLQGISDDGPKIRKNQRFVIVLYHHVNIGPTRSVFLLGH